MKPSAKNRHKIIFHSGMLLPALLLALTSGCQSCRPDPPPPRPDRWVPAGLVGHEIYALAHDHFGRVYAGTESGGLFSSIDQGVTWEDSTLSGTNTACTSVPGKILSIAITQNSRVLLGTEFCGVLFSNTLGPWETGIDSGQTVKDIAIAPNGTIFAAELTGVYRSTDEGLQWEKVAQGVSATAIAINPAANTILAGTTTSLLKSTDGGDTWTEINNIHLHPVVDLAFTPSSHWIALTPIDLFGVHASGNSWADWCCASDSGLVVPPGPGFTSLVVRPEGTCPGSFWVTSDGNGVIEMPHCVTNNWRDYSKGLTDKRVLSSALFQNRPILVGTRSGVFREKL